MVLVLRAHQVTTTAVVAATAGAMDLILGVVGSS